MRTVTTQPKAGRLQALPIRCADQRPFRAAR